MQKANDERWEHGSDFHLMSYDAPEEDVHPWSGRSNAYASGRDALHALLCHGKAVRGWKRLLIPDYYCQKVVQSFFNAGLELALYQDNPEEPGPLPPKIRLKKGDAVLIVNFFGLRSKPAYDAFGGDGIEIIEDHTHDPWSAWAAGSTADWCVLSLRKTLPLPDGGLLWSPMRHRLPAAPIPSNDREDASAKRLAAMLLKRLYLHGHPVAKDEFRLLYEAAEASLDMPRGAAMTAWSMNLLRSFPVQRMREMRRSNHAVLQVQLADLQGVRMLKPSDAEDACPFSCVLIFDSTEMRNRIRYGLIRKHVYTAVLWPLEQAAVNGISERSLALSRNMISVHCDSRYAEPDMMRVAATIRELMRRHRMEQRRKAGVHPPPFSSSMNR